MLILIVPQPLISNPSPSLETYLRDRSDAGLPQRLASQSVLPGSSRYRTQGYHDAPRDDNRTSMMVSGSDRTRDSGTQDLAALTSAATRSTSESVPTSVGARGTEPHHLLELGQGNALLIPRLRAPRILECPFNFLSCFMTFSNLEQWIEHSQKHFGNVGPPRSNICCFCDQTFYFPNGRQSWEERMQHTASHHQLTHRLAHARPNFQLFDYLWNNKLISNAVYKDLKGNGQDRARAAYPSPPVSPNESSVAYTQTHSHRSRHRR